MTAFVVHPEHINVLIWAGLQRAVGAGPLSWYYGNPSWRGVLEPDTATDVGQMLLAENVASVNHYSTEQQDKVNYTYRTPIQTAWTTPELLNALHCYRYQASDRPDWKTSQACAFVDALESRLIRRLPGYTEGPWGIGPDSVPNSITHRV
ncbi:hypothetical protein [Mycobacterium avium]|uniref:hypothetical protein n=1 Tax=Mycobacterium avium TaxID=1764 RepID=UPI000A0434F1|nr:hypothetical protein [Mycobacterium avium]